MVMDNTTTPGDGGQGTSGTAGQQNPPGDGPQGQQGQAGGQDVKPKTFTQEELNQQIEARLQRERQKYADYEDLKGKAKKLQEIEDANKTEMEKLADKIAAAEQRFADSEAKRLEAESEAVSLRRVNAVGRIASSVGAIDPMDANILTATSTIDPMDEAAMRQVIESLKRTKPYLFKGGSPQGVEPFNPGGNAGAAETDAQRIARLQRSTGLTGGLLG